MKRAYFTFGRFQPPTLGHGVLINGVAAEAAKDDADAFVFVSSTKDSKKNPLQVDRKVFWLQKIFPKAVADGVQFIDTTVCNCRTLPSIIGKLSDLGYKEIIMFVGSDRAENFSKFMPTDIEVRTMGNVRNETRANIAGMSGTKMRAAAVAGNIDSLQAGTGLNTANATQLAEEIRSGLVAAPSKSRSRVTRRRSRRTKSPQ
jgi:hypothetical protein